MDMIEWFVGVDWGSEAHQVCIIDGEGSVRGERSFTHTGSGLAEMAAWLLAQAGAAADVIGVAIEVPHGPVVEALMEHGFVVHSLNPKQLDRFRDRFSPAGAKDDRRDARVLADALRTDRRYFRRLDPVDPEVVELREWTRIADDLTVERTPGVGRIVLATLLAEAFDPLRRRDYHALRCLCGTVPVTRRSGKSMIVVRRLTAHNRLRNAVYHWARVAVQRDPTSRAKYAALRARGHGHARALRSVADRLIAVACAMLENQTPFDPEHPRQRHAA